MASAEPGALKSLVDVERGMVSREIFVSEDIYEQERSRSSPGPGSSSATRARSPGRATSCVVAWARSP